MNGKMTANWMGLTAAALIFVGGEMPRLWAQPSTNTSALAETAQIEMIQKLLGRIEQLEKKEADRAEALQKAHQDELQKLQGRIQELEGKVSSLQSNPPAAEIGSAPKSGPTTQELDQKLRVLVRNNELAAEAAEAKAREQPRLTLGVNGLQLASGDTNFVFGLRGLLQVDSRMFFNDGDIQANDAFLLRRARPMFQGTVFRDFDFLFNPEFGGSTVQIYDAYLNYRYTPALQLRAGRFKSPVGLEYLQSDQFTSFSERALPTALSPGRDLGFQLWGDVAGGVMSYAAGVFNGLGDGRNSNNADFDDHREVAARMFFLPFKKADVVALRGLGFGVGGSWGDYSVTNASGLPNNNGYVTDGQQLFFTYTNNVVAGGPHWRVAPQAYYYLGPFGLLGEYTVSSLHVQRNIGAFESARLNQMGWQVAGSWVLTGETASFTGVTPRNNFDPRKGNWGAFQLVARFAELDVDDDAFPLFSNPAASASEAQAWAAGVNWFLNRTILLKASFSRTTFSGGGGAGLTSPAAVTRQPEEVFFTRMQLSF
jgi:phosphate-selective porin OprO and OprP